MANNAPGLVFSLDTAKNPIGVNGAGKAYAFGSKSMQSVSTTSSILAWNSLVTISASSATTQTLPNSTLADIGKIITIKSLGVGIVTIAPYSGNTYSGSIPTLGLGDSITLASINVGVFAVVSSCLGTPVDPSTLTPWAATSAVSQYSERTVTIGGTSIGIVSPTARTTSATFNATEAALWSFTSQSGAATFPVSSVVMSGLQITVSGQLWQSTSTRTTSGVFDVTEQGFWSSLSSSSTGNRVNFGDFTANGSVGLASATVDKAQILSFNQATYGISLTLPTPTTTTIHRTIVLEVMPSSVNGLTFTIGTSMTIGAGSSQLVQWNGTSWNVIGAPQLMAEFGTIVYTGANVTPAVSSTSASASDFMTFTLPTAGVWEIDYLVRSSMNSVQANGNASMGAALYTSANVLIANTEIATVMSGTSAASGYYITGGTATGVAQITTLASTVIKVRVWCSASSAPTPTAFSDANGRSSVSWKKIGGQTPVTGFTVDTLYVTRSGSTQTQPTNWSSRDIIFNTVGSGNIPFNTTTGVATLTAGKTYSIRAELAWNCGGTYGIQWQLVDAVTNAAISGLVEQVQSTNSTFNISGSGLDFTYVPTTNQTVKLRTSSSTGMLSGEALRADLNTYMSITQIGSSAYSGVNITNTGTVGQHLFADGAGGAKFADFTSGGVTSSAGVLTVVTNASLSGAVTSVGNVTSLPVLYGTDSAPIGAVASTGFSSIGGMSVSAATGTNAVVGRANLQTLLRPALVTPQATTDLNALYSAIQGITAPAMSTSATIGTTTLSPGVYDFGSSAVQLTGTLTLTGTATDFWIFKTTGSFATTSGNSVITMGGTATSANVFWLIGNNSPSFGTNTLFRGTMLNTSAIAVAATMTINGRVLSKAGAISVGTGTLMYVPAGICTVTPMGCLSTFLAYTITGTCSTTSTVANYGDVGSGDTAPTAWASNSLIGNVYGPTSMAARVSYALYVAGGLVPYSTRTYDSQTSSLIGVSLESAFVANAGNAIECRQQVIIGSAMVTNKFLNVTVTS